MNHKQNLLLRFILRRPVPSSEPTHPFLTFHLINVLAPSNLSLRIVMGLMELVRFVTAHVFPEAMTANLHNQERQSHRAVDPSIDKPRHGTRARNESASVSEPVSSPDPLCTTTAPPQPVSNRTAGHPYNKPRSIEKCHAGTRPEQTTSVKTRANTNFEPIKVQLSKDEDLMDLDSTSSASDTYIDALADARKKNKILKGKLRAQSLTSDKEVAEAKGEIERWKMKYMQKRDLLREKDIEVRRLQKNYQDHEVSLRSLLNDLDSKLKRAQADLENQLRVNHNLENSLEDCKERIFRSQPFQGPTDKQLVDMYENLCDSIDKWVHRSVADDEDTIERFSKMQFDPTLHTTFGQYLTWHEIMAVSRMPQVGNIMIVSVIMRVVNMRVLRTGFLRLGLDPITNDALDGAVAALSKLDPAKGKHTTSNLIKLTGGLTFIQTLKTASHGEWIFIGL